MDFRIRQVQCFLVLARVLNYGKTARMLYMSQPTLTFQIKSLEESLGVMLFERSRQHVRLTDAGRIFREYAQTIVETVEHAREKLQGLDAKMLTRVACGAEGQLALLPHVTRILASEYPTFELEICEMTTEQQMTSLIEGKVDALLMLPSLPIEGARFEPICQEKMVAMVSAQSSLAKQRTISVEALRSYPVIGSRLKDCKFNQAFLHSLLMPFGIVPKIVESPQAHSVQFAYAAAGEGVLLVGESMLECAVPGVAVRPFEEELPEMTVGITTMEGIDSPAMKVLRKVVMQAGRKLARGTMKRRETMATVSAMAPVEIFPERQDLAS